MSHPHATPDQPERQECRSPMPHTRPTEVHLRIANIEATEAIEIDIPQDGSAKEVFDLYNAHNEHWKGKIADVVLSAGFVSEIEHNVDINKVRTSKGAIRDILSHGKGPLKALALQHIGRIIRDARLYSVGEKDGFRFYNLAHRITFEGKSLYAHLTVKEDRNGKRTYELGFKEKENVVEKLPIGSEPKQRGLGHLTSPQQNDGAKYHVQSQAAPRSPVVLSTRKFQKTCQTGEKGYEGKNDVRPLSSP